MGDIPIREFNADHAEWVMAALPKKLTSASRRQIAQLLSRLLKLAVYPARIIAVSPIPSGFLPKKGNPKALAFLYPSEDHALLSDTRVPLLNRLFYGFLAREGLRSGEAGALTWGNLDLEHGNLTLDENKTDDARAWKLGDDVMLALRAWKQSTALKAKPSDFVFKWEGKRISTDRLAVAFRE